MSGSPDMIEISTSPWIPALSSNWSPLVLAPLAFWDVGTRQSLRQFGGGAVTGDNQFVETMQDLSGNNNNLVAPSSAGRTQYRESGSDVWLAFNGIDDVLRVDLALTGVNTIWMIGDFSNLAATGRALSLGGGAGQDWNTSGYSAVEHDTTSSLALSRSPIARQALTSADPSYILFEIRDDGHVSYGPNGENYTNASLPSLNSARLAVGAAADDTPREYGAIDFRQLGVIDRALTSQERSELVTYIEARLLSGNQS